MGLILNDIDGQTPLDEAQMIGLRIKTISTQEQLNEFEQLNINEALKWLAKKRFSQELILSEKFLVALHKKMFGSVWIWAGTFRKIETNIGVSWTKIPTELRILLDDCSYWLKNETYPKQETIIRFKHRLVCIHCFPNGNGRHSRLMADILSEQFLDGKPFSWGQANLIAAGQARETYLKALKLADRADYAALMAFANS